MSRGRRYIVAFTLVAACGPGRPQIESPSQSCSAQACEARPRQKATSDGDAGEAASRPAPRETGFLEMERPRGELGCRFKASRAKVTAGDEVRVTFETFGEAEAATIDDEPVAPSGAERVIEIREKTALRGTVSTRDAHARCELTITPSVEPVACRVVPSAPKILRGQTVAIRIEFEGTLRTRATLDGVKLAPETTTIATSLNDSRVFRVEVEGKSGTARCEAAVEVLPPPAPPTCRLRIDPVDLDGIDVVMETTGDVDRRTVAGQTLPAGVDRVRLGADEVTRIIDGSASGPGGSGNCAVELQSL